MSHEGCEALGHVKAVMLYDTLRLCGFKTRGGCEDLRHVEAVRLYDTLRL